MPVNFFCSSSCFLYLAAASGFCFSRISLKFRLIGGVSAPCTSNGTSNGACIWGGCTVNVYLPFFNPVKENLPAASVFDSVVTPCSLLIFTGRFAHGLPSKSMIVPVNFPSCAAARVAKHPSIPNARIAASAYVFVHFTIPHSPFLWRSAGLGPLAGLHHYPSYRRESKCYHINPRPRRGTLAGKRWGRGTLPRQTHANAGGNCHRFRKPGPHPDSRTTSTAAARQAPLRGG